MARMEGNVIKDSTVACEGAMWGRASPHVSHSLSNCRNLLRKQKECIFNSCFFDITATLAKQGSLIIWLGVFGR